jgi:hypothetical protein
MRHAIALCAHRRSVELRTNEVASLGANFMRLLPKGAFIGSTPARPLKSFPLSGGNVLALHGIVGNGVSLLPLATPNHRVDICRDDMGIIYRDTLT